VEKKRNSFTSKGGEEKRNPKGGWGKKGKVGMTVGETPVRKEGVQTKGGSKNTKKHSPWVGKK